MADSVVDIVIVGGGGVGSAIAYFLMRLAGPGLRVVVYEKDPTYAQASTTLAAGGIRQQFSTPENVLMSQFGHAFMLGAAEELAVDGDAPDLGLKALSYLRLVPDAAVEEVRAQVEMQRGLGSTPRLLKPGELKQLYPWMSVDDIALAVLGGAGEGLFDPYGLLQALRRKAIALGAVFETAEVVAVERDATGQVAAVRLADGRRSPCGRLVNAAGPRAGAVARLAGLDLPVMAVKAHTFAFRLPEPLDCPVVLDHVQALQFKPEGPIFVAARPHESEQPDPDFEVEDGLFEDLVWPALAHRSTAFETLKPMRSWVGHIEWNRFDGNPVLGPHPDCRSFVFANGFSGHGAQHLPAAGRAIAELLVHGEYRTLDLSRFGYGRLLTGERVPETV
ncbi:MAG TPA: FAD-binding oxidoreductase [Caulobacteraceae bacterium]|nr:FAD-binding oxidoreductase [Caulobacteraceae bacterium]